jgi:hypothetical protein
MGPSPEEAIDNLYAFVCQPALEVYSVFLQMLKVIINSPYFINSPSTPPQHRPEGTAEKYSRMQKEEAICSTSFFGLCVVECRITWIYYQ